MNDDNHINVTRCRDSKQRGVYVLNHNGKSIAKLLQHFNERSSISSQPTHSSVMTHLFLHLYILPPSFHSCWTYPSSSHPSDTKIKIIQGSTQNSKVLLHAGFRYSRDGKPLVDGRQSWRCIKRNKCPGRLYTINDAFHSLGKLHGHPADQADSNAAEARSKIKTIAATSTTSNYKISQETGPLPPDALVLLPGEVSLQKVSQRARRALNPRPKSPLSLAELHLDPEDCRTLRNAVMLLFDNGSDERRVIILAISDNLNMLVESNSWYPDGTFKCSPQLF